MPILDHDDVVDGPLQEGPVVADHHQRARPAVEEVLQRAQRVQVEIVGGLVQQEDVGTLGQHQQQLEPAPLAARQQLDRRPLRVAVEPEPVQQPTDSPVGFSPAGGHGLAHALVRVQLPAELVVVAELHGRAPGRRGRRWARRASP